MPGGAQLTADNERSTVIDERFPVDGERFCSCTSDFRRTATIFRSTARSIFRSMPTVFWSRASYFRSVWTWFWSIVLKLNAMTALCAPASDVEDVRRWLGVAVGGQSPSRPPPLSPQPCRSVPRRAEQSRSAAASPAAIESGTSAKELGTPPNGSGDSTKHTGCPGYRLTLTPPPLSARNGRCPLP